MTDKQTLDRFAKLEIPEERRHLDWSFLEQRVSLSRPLPLEDHALLVLVNGRALVPANRKPAASRSIMFYGPRHALKELETPADQEAAYLSRHEKALSREQKRFYDSIPPSIISEPELVRDATDLVKAESPCPDDEEFPQQDRAIAATARGHLAPVEQDALLCRYLVGHGRMLRIHHKLFELVTLREYLSIFEKAVEPDCYRRLQQVPDTASPDELLQLIEESLNDIHAKARSPMRNKLNSCRVVFNGVTLLPIYQEQAEGLFSTYAALLARQVKLDALARYE